MKTKNGIRSIVCYCFTIILIGLLVLPILSKAQGATVLQRKYGEATTINFVLYEPDGVSLADDETHASGDTKIMKDEGTETDTTYGFTLEGQGYSIALTATEMQAARIVLYIVDQGTPTWLDEVVIIETYGNASAQHAFDLDSANLTVDVVSISGDSTAADNMEVVFNTDFATNYDTTLDRWNVDAEAISGDITTADNLQTMTANMLIVYSTDFATNYDTTADMWNVDLAAISGDTASLTKFKDFVDAGYDDTNNGVNVWTVRGSAPITTGDINAEVDTALNTAIPGSPTADSINERIQAIDDKLPSSSYLRGTAESDGGMDTADKDDINAQVDTALSDIYLDYAFAVDYNPSSKPGNSGALLNELVEDNGSGISRFTQIALSQAPSISEASWDSTTVSSATDAGTFVIASAVTEDDVYNGFLITVTDADGDNEPEPAFVKDYISATKTVILSTKLSFTPTSGDQVRFLAGFGGDYGITLFRK